MADPKEDDEIEDFDEDNNEVVIEFGDIDDFDDDGGW